MGLLIKIFSIEKKKNLYIISVIGGVAEWLNAPVLKTDVGESLPWVRIPPPPPLTFIIAFQNNNLVFSQLIHPPFHPPIGMNSDQKRHIELGGKLVMNYRYGDGENAFNVSVKRCWWKPRTYAKI